jgi:hypothetical protein
MIAIFHLALNCGCAHAIGSSSTSLFLVDAIISGSSETSVVRLCPDTRDVPLVDDEVDSTLGVRFVDELPCNSPVSFVRFTSSLYVITLVVFTRFLSVCADGSSCFFWTRGHQANDNSSMDKGISQSLLSVYPRKPIKNNTDNSYRFIVVRISYFENNFNLTMSVKCPL